MYEEYRATFSRLDNFVADIPLVEHSVLPSFRMIGFALSILGGIGLSPVPLLAGLIGTTEPALKLLITILVGYPLGIIYQQHVKPHKELRHLYFIVTGLDIAIYNFGISFYHNAIPIFAMYLMTLALGPGRNHAIMTFLFNMGYLLVGYFMTESEEYDITWTMPHCVLTLKMIALSFDLWDGQKMAAGEDLSANSKKTALMEMPTFTELIGFVYFPACFLVGPIFSFRRYIDFVNDKFPDDQEVYQREALKRMVQGIFYMAAFQVGVSVFSMQYMMSDDFWDHSVFYRHFHCGMWAHFALYKYIGCWLLTEAACIRFGMSYNGTTKTPDGRTITRWDGCNNIKLMRFETATKFHHYVESFNCNTNHFAAEYIYKRLKFLGNRNVSQFCTLLFLALWHGTRSGYYMTFFNEFIIIFMEKGLDSVLTQSEIYNRMWSNNICKFALYFILKTYTIVFMGWSLVPFDVKVLSKWWSIYTSLFFSGFLLFLPWEFVYKPLIIKALKVTRPKAQ